MLPTADLPGKHNPRCIAIEGNIASGKSTETGEFSRNEHGGWLRTHVALEFTPQPLLRRMYAGKDAFAFQMFVLAYRACQHDTATLLPEDVRFVADRTLLGDVVFANVQRALGHITAEQMAAYVATLEEMDITTRLAGFSSVYYLHVSPEECRARCDADKTRAGAEDSVPVAYFRRVQRAYADALLWLLVNVPSVPVVVLQNLEVGALAAHVHDPDAQPRSVVLTAVHEAGDATETVSWPHRPSLATLGDAVTDKDAASLLDGLARRGAVHVEFE
jgi:deoxyadenosine/deoxycytidine kinase